MGNGQVSCVHLGAGVAAHLKEAAQPRGGFQVPTMEPGQFYFGNTLLLLLDSCLQGTFPNGKVTLCIKGVRAPRTDDLVAFGEHTAQSGGQSYMPAG